MFFVVFICKVSWDLGLKQTQTTTRSRWFGPSSSRPPPTVSIQLPPIPPHVSDIQRGTERHVSLFLYSLLPLLLLLFFLIISKTNMCERGGRRRAETQDGAVSGRLNLYHVGETSNWEIHVPQNTDARLVFPPDEWEAIWKAPFFGCHVEEHTFILHPDLVLRRAYRPEITHFNLLVVCVVLNISSAYQLKPGTTVWSHNVHSFFFYCFKSNKLRLEICIFMLFLCTEVDFLPSKREKKRKRRALQFIYNS